MLNKSFIVCLIALLTIQLINANQIFDSNNGMTRALTSDPGIVCFHFITYIKFYNDDYY